LKYLELLKDYFFRSEPAEPKLKKKKSSAKDIPNHVKKEYL